MKMVYPKKIIESTRSNHLLVVKTRYAADSTSKTFKMTFKLAWKNS